MIDNPLEVLSSAAEAFLCAEQMTFGFQVDEELWSSGALALLTRHGTFRAVKQPIIRLRDGRIEGYEFLSRSSIPGSALPEDFLRFCIEHNMLRVADLHCLSNCVGASLTLPPGLRRHINLYPSTLARVPTSRILDALPGGEAAAYCLELNENFLAGDPADLIAPIDALKRAGVEIAIDDVGFGRSCLESLILLEPDVLKIDKKLVIGIARSGKRKRTLERLLVMAQSLGARAIAEGIETEEDLLALKGLGVEFGQGYYWGRPA